MTFELFTIQEREFVALSRATTDEKKLLKKWKSQTNLESETRDLPEDGRRLSVIMLTDIVGYTALVQSDEKLSLEILDQHNKLLRSFISKYRGVEIKTMGDSFLVEFSNALDATLCAVEIQKFLHECNGPNSKKREPKVKLRIGLHLGDVVHKQGDVFGDAVNIASRILPLANPEGICMSRQVFDQVHNKIDYSLERLEKAELKNVSFPTDVYKVIMPWESRPHREEEHSPD